MLLSVFSHCCARCSVGGHSELVFALRHFPRRSGSAITCGSSGRRAWWAGEETSLGAGQKTYAGVFGAGELGNLAGVESLVLYMANSTGQHKIEGVREIVWRAIEPGKRQRRRHGERQRRTGAARGGQRHGGTALRQATAGGDVGERRRRGEMS